MRCCRLGVLGLLAGLGVQRAGGCIVLPPGCALLEDALGPGLVPRCAVPAYLLQGPRETHTQGSSPLYDWHEGLSHLPDHPEPPQQVGDDRISP